MWQVVLLTLSLLATANSRTSRQQQPNSAASEAQIRFAIENKYDDTGPGAKGREYAYKTYNTLEDALINYLDDPDTKLPDHEREKALNALRLQNQGQVYSSPKRPFPSTFEDYNAYTKQSAPLVVPLNKQNFQNSGLFDLKGFQLNDIPLYQKERVHDETGFQRIQPVNVRPVSVAHYTRGFSGHGPKSAVDHQFDSDPHYSFSYGVNDKRTGDSKSAHESRADGVVRGFYSFVDADGKQRTVLYMADDKEGFKAQVQRTQRETAQ